jgi:hypothetical protein
MVNDKEKIMERPSPITEEDIARMPETDVVKVPLEAEPTDAGADEEPTAEEVDDLLKKHGIQTTAEAVKRQDELLEEEDYEHRNN